MIATMLVSVVLSQNVAVPPAAVEVRPAPVVVTTVGRCDRCGAKVEAVASTINRLRTARTDVGRAMAAVAIRRFNWHCHPEIATALIEALRNDRDDAVRAEAAVSLAKLRVNTPEAISALEDAAASDRLAVRVRAKWSLNVLTGKGPVKALFANKIGA